MTSLSTVRADTGTTPTPNTWRPRFANWAGKDAEFMGKDKGSDFGCRLAWPGRRKQPRPISHARINVGLPWSKAHPGGHSRQA